jgi:hypothetical protein
MRLNRQHIYWVGAGGLRSSSLHLYFAVAKVAERS